MPWSRAVALSVVLPAVLVAVVRHVVRPECLCRSEAAQDGRDFELSGSACWIQSQQRLIVVNLCSFAMVIVSVENIRDRRVSFQ